MPDNEPFSPDPSLSPWIRGRVINVLNGVYMSYGGMTASSLHRARAFYRVAGMATPVVTLMYLPRYQEVRRALLERGELLAESGDINMFEHFRAAAVEGADSRRHQRIWVELLPCRVAGRDEGESGQVARVVYRTRLLGLRRADYLRPDGSCYLSEYDSFDPRTRQPVRRFVLRDLESRVVHRFGSIHALRRRFLEDLAGDEPLFVIMDGVGLHKAFLEHRPRNVYALPVVHNAHTRAPRHHHSPLMPTRRDYLERMDRFDGVIILTDRQRRDIELRFGRRTNAMVVPHAARSFPDLAATGPREPHTCVMLASLGPRKRVGHAIRAFEQVVAKVPDARLEIYGTGRQRDSLQAAIDKRGLQRHVQLMGFRPGARDRLTQASLSLLTSRFEGQPLAVLESLAAGCPVVAYDVMYGPSDMITDGEQGFLVPEGDIDALAGRILTLLRDRELVERMSVAARQRAELEFNEPRLVQRWHDVFERVVEQRPLMTRLAELRVRDLHVRDLRVQAKAAGPVRLTGTVLVDADVPPAARDAYVLGARAYSAGLDVVELPLTAQRSGRGRFRFEVTLDRSAVAAACGPGPWSLTVWLGWNNSWLEAPLGRRQQDGTPPYVLTPGQLSVSAAGTATSGQARLHAGRGDSEVGAEVGSQPGAQVGSQVGSHVGSHLARIGSAARRRLRRLPRRALRRVVRATGRSARADGHRRPDAGTSRAGASDAPATVSGAKDAADRGRRARTTPVHSIVSAVREQRLTYLPVGALNDLYAAAVTADQESRPGVFLEAGCALGGSALVLATAKVPSRPLYVHDVFGMIPPPSDSDGADVHQRYAAIAAGRARGLGGDSYYGYESDLLAKVRGNFERFHLDPQRNAVHLVQGLFQDTITGDEPVALAHIDGDWYESVRTCLQRIGPRLVPGGVMVIDDYFMWSGCRTAVDEFLAEHPDRYRTVRRTRLQIHRVADPLD